MAEVKGGIVGLIHISTGRVPCVLLVKAYHDIQDKRVNNIMGGHNWFTNYIPPNELTQFEGTLKEWQDLRKRVDIKFNRAPKKVDA